jgi:hypothetical protein
MRKSLQKRRVVSILKNMRNKYQVDIIPCCRIIHILCEVINIFQANDTFVQYLRI